MSDRISSRIGAFALAVGLSACSEIPLQPRAPEMAVVPLCQLGCVDIDPAPTAPGIFIGHDFTPDYCFWAGTDQDQDGMRDFCEERISYEFMPELYYWSLDDIRREAYWAARPTLDEGVALAYLPSYYRDNGSNTYICSLPFAPSDCHGHDGDSEAMFLVVYYNPATEHWILSEAWYSEHTGYNIYHQGPKGYPSEIDYPGKKGGYPRAWIAMGKHGNYATRDECNLGGTLWTDDCTSNNVTVRLEWSANWNLGSSSHPLRDCLASRNPSYEYFGAGRQECFWSGSAFAGWIPDSIGGARSSPYGPRLVAFGF